MGIFPKLGAKIKKWNHHLDMCMSEKRPYHFPKKQAPVGANEVGGTKHGTVLKRHLGIESYDLHAKQTPNREFMVPWIPGFKSEQFHIVGCIYVRESILVIREVTF